MYKSACSFLDPTQEPGFLYVGLIACILRMLHCSLESVGGSNFIFAFRACLQDHQPYLIAATATSTFRSSALSILLSGREDHALCSQDGSEKTRFNPVEVGWGPVRQVSSDLELARIADDANVTTS